MPHGIPLNALIFVAASCPATAAECDVFGLSCAWNGEEEGGMHMRYIPDGLHVNSVWGKLPICCVRDALRRRITNPYLHSPHTESDRSELLVRILDMHAKHREPINQMRLKIHAREMVEGATWKGPWRAKRNPRASRLQETYQLEGNT